MSPVKTKKQKSMTMPQIRTKARKLGITPGKMKKTELIHSIQQAENCTPCFGTAVDWCRYTDCCFMADCLKN
ncbi:MAG: SAP domain-containing protein [Planctomycetota bacterium]|nr:MAG: SAP domain-containing protein [Planctomycetota bacterium]